MLIYRTQESHLAEGRRLTRRQSPDSGKEEVKDHISEEVLASRMYSEYAQSFLRATLLADVLGKASSNTHLQKKNQHGIENKPRPDMLVPEPR